MDINILCHIYVLMNDEHLFKVLSGKKFNICYSNVDFYKILNKKTQDKTQKEDHQEWYPFYILFFMWS